MKPALRPAVLLPVLALAVGCYTYSEPPLPRNNEALMERSRQMASSGLDMSNTGPGRYQRSGMSGTSSDVDDNDESELQLGTADLAFVTGVGGPGIGNTLAQADLDAPNELRNPQPRGAVFRPSDHYFINGVDTGPSTDAMPGTGGPAKLKLLSRAEARELKAAQQDEPSPAPTPAEKP